MSFSTARSLPGMTEEERIVDQLIQLEQKCDVRLTVFGLPYPDIICALPMDAVREVVIQHGGAPERATSWEQLLEEHARSEIQREGRHSKPRSFKAYVLDSLGLQNLGADRLVEEAVRVSDGQPPLGCPLSLVVKELVAALGSSPAPQV